MCSYDIYYYSISDRKIILFALYRRHRIKATSFEELFEKTKALPWERYIPENGKFWVTKANSVKSKLFSPSDIQRIMKKAMVERMKQSHKKEWFPEDGAPFLIRVSIMKDEVTVGPDISGESLHKRGYIDDKTHVQASDFASLHGSA